MNLICIRSHIHVTHLTHSVHTSDHEYLSSTPGATAGPPQIEAGDEQDGSSRLGRHRRIKAGLPDGYRRRTAGRLVLPELEASVGHRTKICCFLEPSMLHFETFDCLPAGDLQQITGGWTLWTRARDVFGVDIKIDLRPGSIKSALRSQSRLASCLSATLLPSSFAACHRGASYLTMLLSSVVFPPPYIFPPDYLHM